MSNRKYSSRILNSAGTLNITGGETFWGSAHSKEYVVQTTDATQTTLATIVLDDNTVTKLDIIILGRSSSDSVSFNLAMGYLRNNAGSPISVGSVSNTDARTTGPAWSATVVVSGNNALVKVTGAAATTINWVATIQEIKKSGSVVVVPTYDSPDLVSGLQLWLKSDTGVTTVAGNKISAWADQSGFGRNCSQGTDSLRPVLVSPAVNGLPGLQFDGTDDVLAGTFGITSNDITIMVITTMTSTGNHAVFDSSDGSNTNVSHMLFQEGGSRLFRSGATNATSYAFSSNLVQVNFGVRSSNALSIYEKNVLKGSGTSGTAPNAMNNYRIGKLFQDVYPWLGYILEVVVYNKAISAAEMTGLTSYAVTRYNIA